MKKIKILKEDQKALAKEIRLKKQSRKSMPSGYVPHLWYDTWTYRHRHIAYCIMRGKTIEEIEPNTRPDNLPSDGLVETIIKQFSEPKDDGGQDEIVCCGLSEAV